MDTQSHRQRGAYSFLNSVRDPVAPQETTTVTSEAPRQPVSNHERPVHGLPSAKDARLGGARENLASTYAGASSATCSGDGAQSTTGGTAATRSLRGSPAGPTAASTSLTRPDVPGDQGVEASAGVLERDQGNGPGGASSPAHTASPTISATNDRGDVFLSNQESDSSDGESAASSTGNQDACSCLLYTSPSPRDS